MKLALVTLYAGDDFERMAALVNPPKERYCDRFGYDFIAFQGVLDPDRPPAWSKILAVQQVLPRYDWVFWCDTDAVLWNPDVGLRQFVAAAGSASVIMQRNSDGVNSGLFFIRNCDWAFAFLDEVYNQAQFAHHTWWEQAAIMELLKREDVSSQFQIYPQFEPHGGFHGYYVAREWDKAFIHFAGLREPERLRLIENLVRLAELPPARRLNTRSGLGALLNRLRLLGEGVEVGVAAGDYSKAILDVWEGRRLHLVDAWRHLPDYHDVCNLPDEEHQKLLRSVPGKLAVHEGRYQIHAKLANEAVDDFEDYSLDFVYLDADNSFEGVLDMLRRWYRKLRSGGLLAGHDFVDGELPQGKFGVRRAVQRFEREKGLHAAVTTERDWPSWYFIKP